MQLFKAKHQAAWLNSMEDISVWLKNNIKNMNM